MPDDLAAPESAASPIAAPTQTSRQAQPWLVGGVRVLGGGLGIAGLVLGAILAWRSESATALLIVSAVLLILAMLGLDWERISGTFPGGKVEMQRHIARADLRLSQVVASKEVPTELRAELASVREDLQAASPSPLPSRLPNTSQADFFAELLGTRAKHHFQDRDAVELTLRARAREGQVYTCMVTGPTGERYELDVPPPPSPFGSIFPTADYSVVYPDDFPAAPALLSGQHEVEWRQKPEDTATEAKVVATDYFVDRERTR